MKKLESVVPYKAPVAAAAATKPAPKPAKLSAAESKEISIVKKSLTTKGAQTLPSGKFRKSYNKSTHESRSNSQ